MRHFLSPKYEPKIHLGLLIGMLTAETAKDIMLENPVFASEDEDVEMVVTRMIDTNMKEIAIAEKCKTWLYIGLVISCELA